ncbi:ornithine carbamoyltransferase [Nocardioides sp.]|uniref:ornithine carbamoyltransferase n=1 Tax=Nocardioides sp. TaxID=35761 RepID=UPI0039E45EF7
MGPTHALAALRGRDLLSETDLTVTEWLALVELAATLKVERSEPSGRQRLAGRNLALLFAKASTRTRCAFEVAAHQEGAHVTYLDPECSHLGHRESVADTARVLGRMYDGIAYRGFHHDVVELLADAAEVPVWNALTDRWHPTQSLCDVLTLLEHADKPAGEIAVAYVGDARNNVASSLLVATAMTGMDIRMVAPEPRQTSPVVLATARAIAATTGARVRQTSRVAEGVEGADFIYTDVWLSLGEPVERWRERIDLLTPYRVDAALLGRTGNPEVKFLHCLPALHNDRTELGRELLARTGEPGVEVSDEVFSSAHSIVFDQAENRLHAVKALLLATLGGTT